MFKSLRKIQELVSFAVALGASRLKRHEADIEGLKTAVSSLVSARGLSAHEPSEADSALMAALFNAKARELEVQRLSNLYESLASRLATLEVSVTKEVQHCDKNANDSSQLVESGFTYDKELVAEFEGILRRDRYRLIGNFSRSKGYFGQVAKEYVQALKERDVLLNERDKWFQERQELIRKQGSQNSLNSVVLEFPSELRDLHERMSVCIVDVGAQNLTSEDHVYSRLVGKHVARVIGFEPLKEEASARLQNDPGILMLNHFIGDGEEGVFHVNRFNPASSLLKANQPFLNQFMALGTMCEVISEERVKTTRLDDLLDVLKDCDYLKIDVQGGELGVLRGAMELLERTIVVHSEVEFAPLYESQPLFADVDVFLRSRGFELIDIMKTGYAGYDGLPRPISSSRLMWADAVYFKSPENLSEFGPMKLMRAAYIAHVNYGMYDLAARYLQCLDELVGSETRKKYGERLCGIVLSREPAE
jgi:FkbM family methyltransferase